MPPPLLTKVSLQNIVHSFGFRLSSDATQALQTVYLSIAYTLYTDAVEMAAGMNVHTINVIRARNAAKMHLESVAANLDVDVPAVCSNGVFDDGDTCVFVKRARFNAILQDPKVHYNIASVTPVARNVLHHATEQIFKKFFAFLIKAILTVPVRRKEVTAAVVEAAAESLRALRLIEELPDRDDHDPLPDLWYPPPAAPPPASSSSSSSSSASLAGGSAGRGGGGRGNGSAGRGGSANGSAGRGGGSDLVLDHQGY